MFLRLPILAVTACLLKVAAAGESIALQSSPALVAQMHTLGAVPGHDASSVAEDLSRSLSERELRIAFRNLDRGVHAVDIPAGSLVHSTTHQLNFGFYRIGGASTPTTTQGNPMSDLLMRTLFERKVRGARGRRELAESNSK